jgi:hypothetical protein
MTGARQQASAEWAVGTVLAGRGCPAIESTKCRSAHSAESKVTARSLAREILLGNPGLSPSPDLQRGVPMQNRKPFAAALLSLAALSSAHATDVTLTPNGAWNEFFIVDPAFNLGNTDLSWVDINDYSNIAFSFTVATGFHATVTVVDAAFSGDVFTVSSNGAALAPTSAAVNSYPASTLDYDAALANANFSRGIYGFDAGAYTITGGLLTSALDSDGAPLNATVGALKLEIAPVPEVSSLALLLAGLGAVGVLIRRRTV